MRFSSLGSEPKGHSREEAAVIKRIRPPAVTVDTTEWLDVSHTVEVELTSEDPDHPIEGALLLDRAHGWRAAAPGRQSIALIWPHPIRIRRIQLVFEEQSATRTQEFVLRASTPDGIREIVRQQFTFAPPGTTLEREEYTTNLEGVTRLELAIVPAIDGSDVIATLSQWRIESVR
jgi:hypothetical protein